MGRRRYEMEINRLALLVLLFFGICSFVMVYFCYSLTDRSAIVDDGEKIVGGDENRDEEVKSCCRGVDHLELWGDAVKWGSNFKVDTAERCCLACKDMCGDRDGPCLCDSWVFCGDREACGERFGECWLKKQKDTLAPELLRASGSDVMWTSGLVFGKREGIVKMETEYGDLRIKLLPNCAPRSVFYILELLAQRLCAGCLFYRAETRGDNWDPNGNHIEKAPFGPPYALLQGTLEAHGAMFKEIPGEDCPTIKRGAVAWVGSGPEFFISLANHHECQNTHTVFGYVLPEDMTIVERMARLPTKPEVWSGINVSVLDSPVNLRFRRLNTTGS